MHLPNEVWKKIYDFDPTYHIKFQDVIQDIKLMTTKKLSNDYFDGPSQYWPDYFRFYQKGVWYTAVYTEKSYNLFSIFLYNEKNGTFCQHLHRLKDVY
jgi:hypothetical protein